MVELLTEIGHQAAEYRRWHEAAADPHAQFDPLSMWVNRSATMQSEVLKLLLIWLDDLRHGVGSATRAQCCAGRRAV